MTETQMLELAAKAGGISKQWDGSLVDRGNPCRVWNPLTDDGDALRLAVSLGIGFRHRAGGDGSTYPDLVTVFTGSFDLTEYVSQSGDALSATRLAITKAAAEIGGADHSPAAGKMVPDVCNTEQMTLDEAIVHANEKSIGHSQCAAQHAQLAKWLTDYRAMLAATPKLGGE